MVQHDELETLPLFVKCLFLILDTQTNNMGGRRGEAFSMEQLPLLIKEVPLAKR